MGPAQRVSVHHDDDVCGDGTDTGAAPSYPTTAAPVAPVAPATDASLVARPLLPRAMDGVGALPSFAAANAALPSDGGDSSCGTAVRASTVPRRSGLGMATGRVGRMGGAQRILVTDENTEPAE